MMWIFIGIAIVAIILTLVFLLAGRAKTGVYRNTIEELEMRKYEISNKPVMFEISKLKSVRKSDRIVKLVFEWENRWKDLEEQLVTIEDNIAYAEESIEAGEYTRADEIVEVTRGDLISVAEKIDALLAEIENLKSSEFRNRDGIIKLRKSFAALNSKYEKDRSAYLELEVEIRENFKQIKSYFAEFAEHMEASNYDLADEVSEKIQENLNLLEKAFEKMPLYRESIEIDIKPMLDGILDSYVTMLDDGFFLDHLRVEAGINKCRTELDRIPELLRKFRFTEIENLLIDIPLEAKKLRDAIKHEVDIKEAFERDLAQLKIDVDFVTKEGKVLSDRYDEIRDDCLMRQDDEENFKSLLHEIALVTVAVNNLVTEVETSKKAISDLHTSVLGYLTQMEEIIAQLRIFDEEINLLHSGSAHIKEQSLELLYQINGLKSEYEKAPFERSIPAYKLTLDKADNQISELLEETSKLPLDLARVNLNLKIATDMFYKAQQEVGLAVEQLKMAERLLIYGNRYIEREGIYLMDLTIAEDQFRQGNYKSVVDKMCKILTEVEGNGFLEVFDGLKKELGCVVL